MSTEYIVGVTRKNNTKVGNWVSGDPGEYTCKREEATRYATREEAAVVARRETDGKWRGVVQPA